MTTNALTSQASWTPLHIAASAGREEIVRSLISKGAQLNSVNQNGCTPLHYAASKDRYEVLAEIRGIMCVFFVVLFGGSLVITMTCWFQ